MNDHTSVVKNGDGYALGVTVLPAPYGTGFA